MQIDIKSMIRVRDTVVPLIFTSYRTQLSNITGENTELLESIVFGNLSLKIGQMP